MQSSDVVAGTNATAQQYNDLRSDLINRELAIAYQAVINGNFDIWQRNTSFTNPAHLSYTADRWLVSYQNSGTLPTSIIHSRQALTPGDVFSAFYHYRIAPNGAGSGFAATDSYGISQKIESATRFLCGASKKITISFYAKTSIVGKRLGVYGIQRYGSGGSPTSAENITGSTVTLTSSFTKYTVTLNTNTLVGKTFGTNNDDSFEIAFLTMWGSSNASLVGSGSAETFVGSGNIDISQVQVNAGDVALKFWPRTFADELRACQRYYAKSYTYGAVPGTSSQTIGQINAIANGLSNRPLVTASFPAPMRTIPTITYYSPVSGTSGKCYDNLLAGDRDAVTETVSEQYISMYTTATPTNNAQIQFQWTADAEL